MASSKGVRAPSVHTARPVTSRSRIVSVAAVQELPTIQGPTLGKKYHGPHTVSEEGVNRIVDMLRKGDLFRYGGNDEGSLQVRFQLFLCGRCAVLTLESS
jgi:hypothetical protein